MSSDMHKNTTWHETLRAGFIEPTLAGTVRLDEGVLCALSAVARHVRTSEAVRAYLTAVPKGPGTSCPDSPIEELAKYVEMQKGQIDKHDPYLTVAFLKEFIMPVFAFEREVILRAVENCADTRVFERELFALCTKLGPYYDTLWVKWFSDVVAPYQARTDDEQSHYHRTVLPQLAPQFDYTVFSYTDDTGVTDRQPLATKYPQEIAAIGELLASARELSRQESEPALETYFAALRDATQCPTIDRLETCWEHVDRAWIRIPPTSRLIPVHGMEPGYEHPVCVSPEFRLEVRTTQAQEDITARRNGSIEYARVLRLSPHLVDAARNHLEQIDIAVFCSSIRSGIALNMRFSGQAVPNRQEVLSEGGRIFMDAANNERITGIYRETFTEHVTQKTARTFAHHITPEIMQIHTIDHELAHPIGRTPESDAALGASLMKNLEEAKASLLGVLADAWRSGGDPEYRAQLVTVTVARLLRFMHKSTLEDATADPYVRENRAAAYTLFETGVIRLTEEGVAIDPDKARSAIWFDALKELNLAIIRAYESHDPATLDRLTEHYCDPAYPPIVELIEWVNRPTV